jgi:hypothetical protein
MTELKDVLKRYREIKTEAKATATAYSKRLVVIEDYLRIKLAESGSDTLKTSEGLVMQYERRTVKLTDISAFKAWCVANEVDGLKESVDSSEMLAWLDMHKAEAPPPGLEFDRTKVLAVKGTSDD